MGFLSAHSLPYSYLREGDEEWLHLLLGDWQIVADLAFADLALWLPNDEGVFHASAHVRPSTAHTRFPHDFLDEEADETLTCLLKRAWTSGQWQYSQELEVVPLCRSGRTVAAVSVHRSRGSEGPGELEAAYKDGAASLLEMGRRGLWPDFTTPTGSRRGAPRVGDGFIRMDQDGVVLYASPNAVSAFRRLGVFDSLVGSTLASVSKPIMRHEVLADESLPLVLNGRMPWRSEIQASRTTLTLRSIPLRDKTARVGAILLCRDVSELRRREQELVSKDATIREIHHRVKNNLQTVAALLRMQSRRMESDEGKLALSQAMRRVETIARVHESLSHGLAQTVDFDALIDRQFHLAAEIASNDQVVKTLREGRFGFLPSDFATPLALVINELVTNAVEHGFAGRPRGTVWLSAQRSQKAEGRGEYLVVTVSDDGAGFDPERNKQSAQKVSGLGTQIVKTLVTSELNGRIRWEERPGGGAAVVVELEVPGEQ